jgi:hypothetical protein
MLVENDNFWGDLRQSFLSDYTRTLLSEIDHRQGDTPTNQGVFVHSFWHDCVIRKHVNPTLDKTNDPKLYPTCLPAHLER